MATFALIHGGGDVGWYWHLVEAELRERGHEVVAPDLPCDDDSADGDLRLITTLTSFATAADVTLAELHLEAFLPADECTAEVLRRRWG